jgi:predicted metal-dependent hydrolase
MIARLPPDGLLGWPAVSSLSSDPPFHIRRSDRARRVRVTVDGAGEVEVVLPRRLAERHAAEAVRELRPWIERRRRAVARAAAEVARVPGTVPYLGAQLQLRPEPGRTRVHRRGDVLLVPAGDPREALERWYRRRAHEEVAARLDAATARAGTRYTGLTIRGQRTRWASCSSSGAMSFNWRLLLAPPEVLDYVVEHEVCHLEVMDHSPRFWRLLAARCADWRRQSAWLRRYGSTLVL